MEFFNTNVYYLIYYVANRFCEFFYSRINFFSIFFPQPLFVYEIMNQVQIQNTG